MTVALVAAGLATGASSAAAAPAYVYGDCLSGDVATSSGACAQTSGAAAFGSDSGMDQLRAVVVSPDGTSVYAASSGDDAVAHFRRDESGGALTYVGCITGETGSGPGGSGACSQIASATPGDNNGLGSISALAVSPDGESLYAASSGDDAVAHFDRDTASGALTYGGCITGETQSGGTGSGACVQIPSHTSTGVNSGLDDLRSVVVSPDGRSIYVASGFDHAVARFVRNPSTGAIGYADCVTGESQTGIGGSGACLQIPQHRSGGVDSGLSIVTSVAISPDGATVYATSAGDDAVARFSRNTTNGAIAYQGCVGGETQSGPSGSGACAQIPSARSLGENSGLADAQSLALSADGASLYVAAGDDDAVGRFDRDGGGALTYRGCITGETESGPGGSGSCSQTPAATPAGAASGLDSPSSVAVSPGGDSVHVVSEGDDALASLDRGADGGLSYRGCATGEAETAGSGACAPTPSATTDGTSSGLDFLQSLALGPDGSSLYTASASDDAVARFQREAPATGTVPPGGTGPGGDDAGDREPPNCEISGKRRQRPGKRLKARVGCDEQATVKVGGRVLVRVQRRGDRETRAKRRFRLRAVRVEVEPGAMVRAKPKLRRRARRLAKLVPKDAKPARAKLIGRGTDEAGNVSQREILKVRLKPRRTR